MATIGDLAELSYVVMDAFPDIDAMADDEIDGVVEEWVANQTATIHFTPEQISKMIKGIISNRKEWIEERKKRYEEGGF